MNASGTPPVDTLRAQPSQTTKDRPRSIRRSIAAAVLAAQIIPAMALFFAIFVTDRYAGGDHVEKDVDAAPVLLLYYYVVFSACFGFVFVAAKLLKAHSATSLVAISLVVCFVLVTLFYFAWPVEGFSVRQSAWAWITIMPFALATVAGMASLYCYVARIPFRST